MKAFFKPRALLLLLPLLMLLFVELIPPAFGAEKAELPVMLTSCGQSLGPEKLKIFLKKLQMDHVYNAQAPAKDLIEKKNSGAPFKSIIIVTGSSLKGMGAAGVSINDELARAKGLIEEAKRQGMKIIGAHVEGMARRAQGAAPGDNSDEQSIDAVCPFSSLLLIKKEGNEDGRFTTISKEKNIPMMEFEKNAELEQVLRSLFAR
jgi:hypothetical protein